MRQYLRAALGASGVYGLGWLIFLATGGKLSRKDWESIPILAFFVAPAGVIGHLVAKRR